MAPRPKSTAIRKRIIDDVEAHPRDIAKRVMEVFGISRQAVNRHLALLVEEGVLEARGRTREREYRLKGVESLRTLPLAEFRDEDRVWRSYVGPFLADLPGNVQNIGHYGFTEMFNNAVDHSEGSEAVVAIERTARGVRLSVHDNGIGIFEKIKTQYGLDDHRQVILELSKGKLTTDPRRHSGQGIFFSSRMFDAFSIRSGHLGFTHRLDVGDWRIEANDEATPGTLVSMWIAADARRTAKEVFDLYSDLESGNYEFSRTQVPLTLARYGEDNLLSRSQARRVLARVDQFEEVLLNFDGIASIGQAFADEIFRVFASSNPGIKILAINANPEVEKMINRARSARAEQGD